MMIWIRVLLLLLLVTASPTAFGGSAAAQDRTDMPNQAKRDYNVARCFSLFNGLKADCFSDWWYESVEQNEARAASKWWQTVLVTAAQIYEVADFVKETVGEWGQMRDLLETAVHAFKNPGEEVGYNALIIRRTSNSQERYQDLQRVQERLARDFRGLDLGDHEKMLDAAVARSQAIAQQAEDVSEEISAQALQLQSRLGPINSLVMLGDGAVPGFSGIGGLPAPEGDVDETAAAEMYGAMENFFQNWMPGHSSPQATSGRAGAYFTSGAENSTCPPVENAEDLTPVEVKRLRALAIGGQLQGTGISAALSAQMAEMNALEAAEIERQREIRRSIDTWLFMQPW